MNFTLPTLGDLSTDEGQQQVKSYLYQLTDQLRFALSHIDQENLSPALQKQYENAVTVSESFAKLDTLVKSLQGRTESGLREVTEAIGENRDALQEAYEDLRASLTRQAELVKEQYESAIEESETALSSRFSREYTLLSETAALREQTESAFLQTAEEIMAVFSETYEVESDDLSSFADAFRSYIRFTQNGLELGKSGSSIVARLQNDRLSFVQLGSGGGYEVAYISDKKLYITEANVTSTLTLGEKAHGFLYDAVSDPRYGLTLTLRRAEE